MVTEHPWFSSDDALSSYSKRMVPVVFTLFPLGTLHITGTLHMDTTRHQNMEILPLDLETWSKDPSVDSGGEANG